MFEAIGQAAVERFFRKVDADGVCWEFTGALCKGYGHFSLRVAGRRAKWVYAHRFAYTTLVGPIPDGLELDHLCRNKACVNPDHLEPVTHEENMRRCPLKGRPKPARAVPTHCPQNHHFDAANTGRRPDGSRYCRACARTRMRANRKEFATA